MNQIDRVIQDSERKSAALKWLSGSHGQLLTIYLHRVIGAVMGGLINPIERIETVGAFNIANEYRLENLVALTRDP